MSYKRILLSVSMIAFVGALVVGATGAFFSDTETSTGNTFTAGAIDLTVGNDSYYTNEAGELASSATTSWDIGDLDGQVFFDFADLKPGDIGEDTISINVDSNDAWACMATNITATPENDVTEPEAESPNEDDDQTDQMLDDGGELQDQLMFAAWADDGDNVYEDDERLYYLGGQGGDQIISAQELADTGVQPLADSTYNGFVDGTPTDTPLTGGETYHIGKAWCLGDMTATPEDDLDDDDFSDPDENNPADRGTGFNCEGASVGNETQTDGITSSIQFYAVQSRNNGDFTCAQDADFGGDNAPTIESVTPDDGSDFSAEYGEDDYVLTIDADDVDGDLERVEIDNNLENDQPTPLPQFSLYADVANPIGSQSGFDQYDLSASYNPTNTEWTLTMSADDDNDFSAREIINNNGGVTLFIRAHDQAGNTSSSFSPAPSSATYQYTVGS